MRKLTKGKVLGPLGAYIKINEGYKNMGLPIEKVSSTFLFITVNYLIIKNVQVLGKFLRGFIVTNISDREALVEVIKRTDKDLIRELAIVQQRVERRYNLH